MTPILIITSLLFGILGGIVYIKWIATDMNMSVRFFLNVCQETISTGAVVATLVKGVLFGGIVGLVPYVIADSQRIEYHEVGKVTTTAVIWSSILVILMDAIVHFAYLQFR